MSGCLYWSSSGQGGGITRAIMSGSGSRFNKLTKPSAPTRRPRRRPARVPLWGKVGAKGPCHPWTIMAPRGVWKRPWLLDLAELHLCGRPGFFLGGVARAIEHVALVIAGLVIPRRGISGACGVTVNLLRVFTLEYSVLCHRVSLLSPSRGRCARTAAGG